MNKRSLALTLATVLVAGLHPSVGHTQHLRDAQPARAHAGDFAAPRAMALIDGVVTGVATTLVSVPLGLALANVSTNVSPNLIGGGIPALLFMAVAPPFAIAGATTAISNYYEPGAYRLWTSLVFTLPVHWGAMAVGVVSGVWLGNFGSLAALTLAESILLPAVSVGMLQLFRRPSRATSGARAGQATASYRTPGVPTDLHPAFANLRPMQQVQPLAVSVPLFAGAF